MVEALPVRLHQARGGTDPDNQAKKQKLSPDMPARFRKYRRLFTIRTTRASPTLHAHPVTQMSARASAFSEGSLICYISTQMPTPYTQM